MPASLDTLTAGWLGGWVAGWLVGWVAGWLAGWTLQIIIPQLQSSVKLVSWTECGNIAKNYMSIGE